MPFSKDRKEGSKPNMLLALYDDITAQIEAAKATAERVRLADLAAGIGVALSTADSLRQGLEKSAEILAGQSLSRFPRICRTRPVLAPARFSSAPGNPRPRTRNRTGIERLFQVARFFIASRYKSSFNE